MKKILSITVILNALCLSPLAQSQWTNRPAEPAGLGKINGDVLLSHILRSTQGPIPLDVSSEERKILQNKQHPRYQETKQRVLRKFLHNYKADLKTVPQLELEGRTRPARVEFLEELGKREGFNVKDLTPLEDQLKIKETGSEVATRYRKGAVSFKSSPRSWLGKVRGGLFSVADVALLAATEWKHGQNQKILEEIIKDASEEHCPSDPSDDYAKHFLFQDLEVQKSILTSCQIGKEKQTPSLVTKIQKQREQQRKKFSTGRAQCFYKNGQPTLKTLGDSGTQQEIFFHPDGSFAKLRILPQPKTKGRFSDYEGSYLEYSSSPPAVSYYAIQDPRRSQQGPDLGKSHMKEEPLNSFSARIHCAAVEVCSNETPEFKAIRKDESFVTTPSEPFGRITANREFLIQAAKSVAQFRLGLEQNLETPLHFKSACSQLGATPPKEGSPSPQPESVLEEKKKEQGVR